MDKTGRAVNAITAWQGLEIVKTFATAVTMLMRNVVGRSKTGSVRQEVKGHNTTWKRSVVRHPIIRPMQILIRMAVVLKFSPNIQMCVIPLTFCEQIHFEHNPHYRFKLINF